MVNFKSLACAAFAAVAVANPVSPQKRQESGSVTCARNTYSASQIDSAIYEGCNLHAEGQTVGRNDYPHAFHNREGLPLETDGPYQEFPILTSGVYTGGKLHCVQHVELGLIELGSPGADRVVFNPNYNGECVFVGAITHTGAPGNGFVSCE